VRSIQSPLHGSSHVLFIVRFNDGACWLFKVPSTGHPDDVIRVLKKEKTIPLPKVYCFSASLDNELGCPFILMEFIEGKTISDVWFNKSIPEDILDQQQIKYLQDIATAMLQLNKFEFDHRGSVNFEEAGLPSKVIGPTRITDLKALLEQDDGRPDASKQFFFRRAFRERWNSS